MERYKSFYKFLDEITEIKRPSISFERDTEITRDDITDLTILLNTTNDVTDFLMVIA